MAAPMLGEVCLDGHVGGHAGDLAHSVSDGVGVFGVDAGVGQAAGRWRGCRERPLRLPSSLAETARSSRSGTFDGVQPGSRRGVAVFGEGLDSAAAGAPRTKLRLRGGSPTADGASAAAVQPGRDAVAPDIASLCQLRVEVVRQCLQGCNVDLAIGDSLAFVGLVEIVAELPGSAGDCSEETLEAGLVAVLLLPLLLVGRARA